jgi:hypothetical protein
LSSVFKRLLSQCVGAAGGLLGEMMMGQQCLAELVGMFFLTGMDATENLDSRLIRLDEIRLG